MQNLGGQRKSIMVFSEVAYCTDTLDSSICSLKKRGTLTAGSIAITAIQTTATALRNLTGWR